METRDHRAGRYHEIWRQEVVELGGSMEYGDKRSQRQEVPWKMKTRYPTSKLYHGMWRQKITDLGDAMEFGDKKSWN